MYIRNVCDCVCYSKYVCTFVCFCVGVRSTTFADKPKVLRKFFLSRLAKTRQHIKFKSRSQFDVSFAFGEPIVTSECDILTLSSQRHIPTRHAKEVLDDSTDKRFSPL